MRKHVFMLPAVAVALCLTVLLAVPRLIVWYEAEDSFGDARIPGPDPSSLPTQWTTAVPSVSSAAPGEPPYVTSPSASRRYFLDQYGKPILVRGDSPWSLMTDLSSEDVAAYFTSRKSLGFNAAIVSLLGASGNGGPSDNGTTLDGLRPFEHGDVTRLAPAYWDRAHDYLETAAAAGITIFLYPIDAWSVGHSFRPRNLLACAEYGRQVATRFADLRNIVWLAGGDYLPQASTAASASDVDHCIESLMSGIRSTGDNRIFSVQIGYDGAFLTTDSPFWRGRVDWNFVYTYYPTFSAVLAAYQTPGVMPAIMGEANYERENNQAESKSTTNESLRRQVVWALTCGAAGDFYGSSDWSFPGGWQDRLDSPGAVQVNLLRNLFEEIPWWRLVPDMDSHFVTKGRGNAVTRDARLDVLDNDYATAALSVDGRYALVYLPTARQFHIDPGLLKEGTRATWIDPSNGSRTPVAVKDRYVTPRQNGEGTSDWILLFTPRV